MTKLDIDIINGPLMFNQVLSTVYKNISLFAQILQVIKSWTVTQEQGLIKRSTQYLAKKNSDAIYALCTTKQNRFGSVGEGYACEVPKTCSIQYNLLNTLQIANGNAQPCSKEKIVLLLLA